MKPLEINLARRPYRNDVPIGIVVSLLLIGALLFSGTNIYTWLTADARLATLKQEMEDHESRMRAMEKEAVALRAELDDIDLEVLVPQAEFVGSVLQQRNFSWTLLFNALEEVLPWNVRLSVVRPRFQMGSVLINVSGMARDFDGYLDFQESLLQSKYFSDVVPAGYDQGRNSDSRLIFSLDVQYLAAEHRADQLDKGEGVLKANNEVIVVDGEDGDEAEPNTGETAAARRDALSGPEGAGAGDVELAAQDEKETPAAGENARGRRGRRGAARRDANSAARSHDTERKRRGRAAAAKDSAPGAGGRRAGSAVGVPVAAPGLGARPGESGEGLLSRPTARPGARKTGSPGAAPRPAAGPETKNDAGRARPDGQRPGGEDVPPPEMIQGAGGPMLGSPVNPDKPLPWDPTKGGPPEQGQESGGADEGSSGSGSEGGGSEGGSSEGGSSNGGGTAS